MELDDTTWQVDAVKIPIFRLESNPSVDVADLDPAEKRSPWLVEMGFAQKQKERNKVDYISNVRCKSDARDAHLLGYVCHFWGSV